MMHGQTNIKLIMNHLNLTLDLVTFLRNVCIYSIVEVAQYLYRI